MAEPPRGIQRFPHFSRDSRTDGRTGSMTQAKSCPAIDPEAAGRKDQSCRPVFCFGAELPGLTQGRRPATMVLALGTAPITKNGRHAPQGDDTHRKKRSCGG